MRKFLYISLILILIASTVAGSSSKNSMALVEEEWILETISDMSGEILVVGKGYIGYENFDGQKKDILATFKEDGTFKILGGSKSFQGEYNKDNNTNDTIVITMNFNTETTLAALGTREYSDGKEVKSLIFTFDNNTYSFINR